MGIDDISSTNNIYTLIAHSDFRMHSRYIVDVFLMKKCIKWFVNTKDNSNERQFLGNFIVVHQ